MSHGPMRGKRYGGGCGCCGGNEPPGRAAEKRDWGIEAQREIDDELRRDLLAIERDERAARSANRSDLLAS